MTTNKDVVLNFVEAIGRCDGDLAGQYLADDLEHQLMKHPFNHLTDREGYIRKVFEADRSMPGGIKPTVTNIFAEGDRVAIEYKGNGFTPNGEPYENRYCLILELEGEKIKSVHQYLCTALAADTFSRPA